MVATVRPIPGQTDEQFFQDVKERRAIGGKYKPEEYTAWLEKERKQFSQGGTDG